MVRSDGKRYPTPTTFTLAELKIIQPASANDAGRLAAIGRFKQGSEDIWGADLSRRIYLSPQLLDACVLDENGLSILRPGARPNLALTVGWEKMPNKIDAWRKQKVGLARGLRKLLPDPDFDGKEVLIAALDRSVFGTSFQDQSITVSIDMSDSSITTGIRRIARLVEGHARRVLILNSTYQARPDSPADMVEEEPAEVPPEELQLSGSPVEHAA